MDKKARLSASIVAGLAAFLAPFMGASVNIALPSIGREFGADAVQLGWVATAYILAAAVFLVPFGKLADIHGRKKIFLTGILVYTAASLLCALAETTWVLVGFRVLQGIGAALIFGTSVAILTSVFPPGQRGKALGINTASTYLGLSLGPVLGGLLTQQFGWRSIFLVNLPLGLIIIAFVLAMLKGEWAEAKGERFDLFGAGFYGLTLIGIMLGFSRLPQRTGFLLFAAGVVLAAGFVLREVKTDSPLLKLDLFRKNRVFAFSNLAALINYSATFAVGFFVSLYLQYLKGLSPRSAGLILIAQPVMMTVFSPFAGRLSDRIEPRIVASLGMAISSLGLLLLAFLRADTALTFVIASLAVLGFGFALFSSPNTNAVMCSVEKQFYGVASATLGTMRLVGQTLSMGIAMLIFGALVGRIQITPANQGSFLQAVRTGFVIFAALCFAGVFASLARGNRRSAGLS
jgi:EmrB/QacA subfamily drug resistance transporter